MPIDVARLRADTPGCEAVAHLNNAGASMMPDPVADAVVAHVRLEARLGGYEAAAAAAEAIDAARRAVADLVRADPLDVALTQSDTAAWNKAFWGLALGGWFDGGGRVLVDRTSYSSHYLSLRQAADRFGFSTEIIGSSDDGSIDLGDLERRIDGSVRLVSATHVGTHRGLVNPVAGVGAVTSSAGVPYFLDACQSVGQLPVDVAAIGCDVATATGRKFLRGPRGTGLLFVRPEWAERMQPPGIDTTSAAWRSEERFELGARAQRFEEFETSYAARIGLGVAVGYALGIGIASIADRVGALAEQLRDALRAIGAEVHDGGTQRCGIVTFTMAGVEAPAIRDELVASGVNVSLTSGNFAPLDMTSRGLEHAVRASPHAFNTAEELDRLVSVVGRVAAR